MNAHVRGYNLSSAANFFLKKGQEENIPITPMKLLKLVYLAYAWHYWATDEKMFEEPIEAWRHGPVVPALYHEFKHFGYAPITDKSQVVAFNEDQGDKEDYDIKSEEPEFSPVNDTSIINTLNFVWNTYKDFSGWQLRNITHEKEGPWAKAWAGEHSYDIIKDDDIKAHYAEKAKTYGIVN